MTAQQANEMKTGDTDKKPAPVVVDLGKRGKRAVKRLRNGEGKLFTEVTDLVDQLCRDGSVRTDAQLVVVVVRQRRSRSDSSADWALRC